MQGIVRHPLDVLVHEGMACGDNGEVELSRPPLVHVPKGRTGGTSGLHRTA